MARLDWQQTWDGLDFNWAETWSEGQAFELSAPPVLTLVASLGISGSFVFHQAKALAGGATAAAQMAGTLVQTGPMGAQAVASAQMAGSLSVGILLGGAATARAQAVATMLAVQPLFANALVSAIASGTLAIGLPEPAVATGRQRRRIGRNQATAATTGRIGRSSSG